MNENNGLAVPRRCRSYKTSGFEAWLRGGPPSEPMRDRRGATPRKLHFLMILTISGIRISGNRKMWTGD